MIHAKRKDVKMSTFLTKDRILIQIDYRYMVFDDAGQFIDQI